MTQLPPAGISVVENLMPRLVGMLPGPLTIQKPDVVREDRLQDADHQERDAGRRSRQQPQRREEASTVVTARCQIARAIGTRRPVITASSSVRSVE